MGNKSDTRSMLKDALVLFAITLIAGLVLGFVYELTKEPIRIQKEKQIQAACQAVFGQADHFEEFDYTLSEELTRELSGDGVTVGTAYHALASDGSHLGFVIRVTSSEGFGGNITLYLGVEDSGTLNGISILEISETPGLGMRADEVLTPQFRNKNVDSFAYTKTGSRSDSEIDAISGATITTRAVTNAVNGGLRAVREELAGTVWEGGNSNE